MERIAKNKSAYLLGDLMNFNRIFRKNVTSDNIKNTVNSR